MNPEVQKQSNRQNSKIIVIFLVTFILLMLAVAGQLIYTILNYDRVYKGVHVEGYNLSGMTYAEVESFLKNKFEDNVAGMKLTLKAGDYSEVLMFSDIDVKYDVHRAADEAYGIGRTGHILKRLREILIAGRDGITLAMPVSFDKGKLEMRVQSLYDKTLIKVKEADVLIGDNTVTIRTGHHGENIDKEYALAEIEKAVNKHMEMEIDIPVIITQPNKLNADELFSQINREPQDATTVVENNIVRVVPHVTGRSIEKPVLAGILEELKGKENVEKILPVAFTEPEFTTEKVQSLLFKDTLATMNTSFSTSNENNKNRAENIKLAVSKIDGRILAPGEIFSFNDVVGPRTAEGGYKAAHAYVGGKVIDDIGGGICQVSSTLYNAVLFSDLEVVERRNHMFTVGYVPVGRDATVSYGSVDFKFRNSTRWPIRIKAWVSDDNKVHFSLIGTNETPGKTVELVQTILKTTPFNTVYIDDPNLPEGQSYVKQAGSNGYVVETYKIIKQDGKVVSNKKLHTSTYQPLNQEVVRGTKKMPVPPDNQEPAAPNQGPNVANSNTAGEQSSSQ